MVVWLSVVTEVLVGDYFVCCVQNLASGVLALSVGNVWQRGNGQSLSRHYTATQLEIVTTNFSFKFDVLPFIPGLSCKCLGHTV